MSEETERWLVFAREDLQVAEMTLRAGIANQVCFHSQQCVEKSLKALILKRGKPLPRTHRLVDLIVFLQEPALSDFTLELQLVDRFYIPTRYPDALPSSLPEGLPNLKDANDALQIAQRILTVVEKLI